MLAYMKECIFLHILYGNVKFDVSSVLWPLLPLMALAAVPIYKGVNAIEKSRTNLVHCNLGREFTSLQPQL